MTDAEFEKLVDAFGQKAHDVGAGQAVEGLGESRRKVLDAHAEVVVELERAEKVKQQYFEAQTKMESEITSLEEKLASALADRDFWKLQRTPLTEAELERGYAIAKKHGVDVERIRELEGEVEGGYTEGSAHRVR